MTICYCSNVFRRILITKGNDYGYKANESTHKKRQGRPSVLRAVAVSGGILLVVWMMAFVSAEIQWSVFDYIVAGIMLFTVAGAVELIVARVSNQRQRLLLLAVVGVVFMYLWAELAVGVFINLGN